MASKLSTLGPIPPAPGHSGSVVFRISSCIGKQRFETLAEAQRVLRIRSRRKSKDRTPLEAYACKCCGFYHHGSHA